MPVPRQDCRAFDTGLQALTLTALVNTVCIGCTEERVAGAEGLEPTTLGRPVG